MVNAKFGEESKESVAEEDSGDDVEPIAEFRFVPSDKSATDTFDSSSNLAFTITCKYSHG